MVVAVDEWVEQHGETYVVINDRLLFQMEVPTATVKQKIAIVDP